MDGVLIDRDALVSLFRPLHLAGFNLCLHKVEPNLVLCKLLLHGGDILLVLIERRILFQFCESLDQVRALPIPIIQIFCFLGFHPHIQEVVFLIPPQADNVGSGPGSMLRHVLRGV